MRNKWEDLFVYYLDLTEFSLVKYADGTFGLDDRQGANLGEIESERFETAQEIFSRMECYINDYILEPLDYGVDDYEFFDDKDIDCWSCETWLSLRDKYVDMCTEFFTEYKEEFDICDMIANHYEEINLENCYTEKA